MLFDKTTSIYRGAEPTQIPDGLDIYDFMFSWRGAEGATPRPDPTASTWLIDAKDGRTLDFQGAKDRTDAVARAWHSLGVGAGDAVCIFSSNEVDYATSIWATFRLGGVVTCANPQYRAAELTFQLEVVNKHNPIKVVLVHPDSLLEGIEAVNKSGLPTTSIVLIREPDETTDPKAADLANNYRTIDAIIAELQTLDLPPKPRPDRTTTAFYVFSSGTTGLPKAVQIPHYSVMANVMQSATHWSKALPFTPYDSKTRKGDVVMGCLPFYHIYGLVVVLHQSLFLATPVVVLRKFTFPTFLAAIERHKITILYVVPPMVVLLVKNAETEKHDLSSVRAGMTGAAPLTEETSVALRKKFPKWTFGQGYGMTETCTIISLFDPSAPNGTPGASAGRLVPNIDAKIVSPEGQLLPPGGIGELWTRSPSNALGYLGNEKATRETFDEEGFVHTGDECRFDEHGWLYVVDRIKELIKVKGNQVAPAELEGHLLEHPLVQDCAVIGIPDDRAGERPKAYIHLVASAAERLVKDPSSAKEMEASIRKHVADAKIHYKHLGACEFIPAIPKTPSGKLLRKDLRALHAASEKSKTKL